MVVFAHTFEAFYWPYNAFDRPYYIFTLPFFRLLFQGGYLSVSIFFVMSGFVCAMKPLKLARQGKADDCRKAVASSALRRVLRICVPSMAVTAISWFLDRIGAFSLSRSLPGWCWLNLFTPESFGFFESIRHLWFSFVLFLDC
jgi:peptidoglycan/LPS O-acetylase OafA/YrhL